MCDVYLCLNSERFKKYAAAAFIFPESTQLYIYLRGIYIFLYAAASIFPESI